MHHSPALGEHLVKGGDRVLLLVSMEYREQMQSLWLMALYASLKQR